MLTGLVSGRSAADFPAPTVLSNFRQSSNKRSRRSYLMTELLLSFKQLIRIFTILKGWPRHLIPDLNEEALTSLTNLKKKKLPVVEPPLNFPDLTGWGVWGATSWRAIRQIWGQVEYLLSGSVAGEVSPIRPDSKDLRDFARLPTAFNRGFEPRTSNRV